MTERADGIDTTVAHNARVWNYWLGGEDHFEVDARVGAHVTSMFPGIAEVARADRAFLGRAVTWLAGEAGVRQFLDVGSGLPARDNTHEVARRAAPDARVVYVDNDPTVLRHARTLLADAPGGATAYVEADAREPGAVLRAAGRTLDLDRPVAVLLLGVLNFVQDTDEAVSVARRLMAAVPSGSHLVLTHPTLELGGGANEEAMRFWNENATPPITPRPRAEVLRFFEGLELLEPGLVSCSRWHPGGPHEAPDAPGAAEAPEAPEVAQFGAVARKP
ncbi:SAM-dependent methyltransferase [Streptomyces albiaxialis]|uniref:SAM-dependent methyltransferase n=1 Tax=Streptomyces albiaxialis TaxID=329523 RepID=A0ABN2WAZ7_9ACTN